MADGQLPNSEYTLRCLSLAGVQRLLIFPFMLSCSGQLIKPTQKIL